MASSFKNAVSPLIGITAVSVYTVPASTTATVIGVSIANLLTTLVYASIYVTVSGQDIYILKNVPIPSGSTLIPIGGDQKLILMAGNIFKVVSSDAASISCFVSYLETT